jgi:hypothetical protein
MPLGRSLEFKLVTRRVRKRMGSVQDTVLVGISRQSGCFKSLTPSKGFAPACGLCRCLGLGLSLCPCLKSKF